MTDEQHTNAVPSPEAAPASGDAGAAPAGRAPVETGPATEPVAATGTDAATETAAPAAAAVDGDGADALRRERDDYLDQLRRVSADFQNYKKRMAREQESLGARATERLVKELLPVLDDLERALAAFEAHDEAQVAKGVELVHRSLSSVLRREGVTAIEPSGQAFDPHRHEALLSQPSEEPEGTVIQVVQKGFVLGDRVVRPARVVVAAPKD